MAHLLIVRGLPGSGKSTFAKSLGRMWFEADMWMVEDGKYKFDKDKLSHCHSMCQRSVKAFLDAGIDVVVSNTFSRIWEMEPYMQMTENFTIVMCEGNFPNVHGVPDEVIQKMRDRWEFL